LATASQRASIALDAKTMALRDHLSKQARSATSPMDIIRLCMEFTSARLNGSLACADTASAVDISIVSGLAHTMRGKDDRGRRHPAFIKRAFARILMHGGPAVHNYVSGMLLGPSLSTTRRELRNARGDDLSIWDESRFKTGADILQDMGLADAPCILTEDSTALVPHADVCVRVEALQNGDKQHVVVMVGLVGGAIVFRNMEDVHAFKASMSEALQGEARHVTTHRHHTSLHCFTCTCLFLSWRVRQLYLWWCGYKMGVRTLTTPRRLERDGVKLVTGSTKQA
jgi:hypothetical protein